MVLKGAVSDCDGVKRKDSNSLRQRKIVLIYVKKIAFVSKISRASEGVEMVGITDFNTEVDIALAQGLGT